MADFRFFFQHAGLILHEHADGVPPFRLGHDSSTPNAVRRESRGLKGCRTGWQGDLGAQAAPPVSRRKRNRAARTGALSTRSAGYHPEIFRVISQ